jgi:hypothetical protein
MEKLTWPIKWWIYVSYDYLNTVAQRPVLAVSNPTSSTMDRK